MKNLKFVFALCALTFLAMQLNGQEEVIWRGGHPGDECNWNQPLNWSNHRIPAGEDVAVIPNLNEEGGCYPIITTSLPPFSALQVEKGAYLRIATSGQLLLDGGLTMTVGITLHGQIENQGQILIVNPVFEPINGQLDHLQNTGDIYLVDTEKEIRFRYSPGMDLFHLLSQQ